MLSMILAPRPIDWRAEAEARRRPAMMERRNARRLMPKMKTKRAAAKRFKRTASGRLKRAARRKRHKLEAKPPQAQAPWPQAAAWSPRRTSRASPDRPLPVESRNLEENSTCHGPKGGAKTRQRRKKVLKQAKGYFGGRRKLYRTAAETVLRAGAFAYKGRKQKKRRARAPLDHPRQRGRRQLGLSYSVLHERAEEGGRRDRPQDPRRARRLRPGRLRQARGDGPGRSSASAWRADHGPGDPSTGPWRISPGPDPRRTSSRSACACSAARGALTGVAARALGGIAASEDARVSARRPTAPRSRSRSAIAERAGGARARPSAAQSLDALDRSI